MSKEKLGASAIVNIPHTALEKDSDVYSFKEEWLSGIKPIYTYNE